MRYLILIALVISLMGCRESWLNTPEYQEAKAYLGCESSVVGEWLIKIALRLKEIDKE